MNPALMNQNTLPFVNPPSGPLASAPVASAGNQNMWYNSTDFGLCKCVSVFNNAGSDWIDCGRPSFISHLSTITRAGYRCKVVFKINANTWSTLVGLGTSSPTTRQLQIGVSNTGVSANLYLGGASSDMPIQQSGTWGFLDINYPKTGLATASTTLGTTVINSGVIADYTGNLMFGVLSDGNDAAEASTAFVKFWDSDGKLLDNYDFNRWDGTGSGASEKGNIYNVTDGTPFTAKSYSWIPWSVLQC